MADRYAVLGFARPRTGWFRDVGHWAISAVLPVDFVKCVSAAELRTRMETVAGLSAVLVDASGHGVDRDLLAAGRDRSIAVIVVERVATSDRDWMALGAAAVLDVTFDADDLLGALRDTAQPVRQTPSLHRVHPGSSTVAYSAPLVAVTGVRGAGASTLAAALAQGLAGRADGAGSVVLADCALDAMQSTYHDTAEVAPAIQELVEAHRSSEPDRRSVRGCTFEVERRGYSLLLGLRRPRDWTALPARAVDAAIESLRGAFRWVVADCTPEFDGDAETGSVDLEERNHLARRCVGDAAVVVAVGGADLRGVRQLVRLIDDLVATGVEPRRIVAVINRAPRSPAARAALSSTVAQLASSAPTAGCVHIPFRRSIEAAHRGGEPFAPAVVSTLTAAIVHVEAASRLDDEPDAQRVRSTPMAISR